MLGKLQGENLTGKKVDNQLSRGELAGPFTCLHPITLESGNVWLLRLTLRHLSSSEYDIMGSPPPISVLADCPTYSD